MGIFYVASDKQVLTDRNNIFLYKIVPILEKKGFIKSPFGGAWHGEYDKSNQAYIYDFCRISKKSQLEILKIYIVNKELSIQILLNIFQLSPPLDTVEFLKVHNGVNYSLPPNSETKMRLRSDDYKGLPLFHMLFSPEYKIGRYFTKSGYSCKIKQLEILLVNDMQKIEKFTERWHELHRVKMTNWDGLQT